jgi:NADPH:quinone reductase-like Zn-dependent oxidoreductase
MRAFTIKHYGQISDIELVELDEPRIGHNEVLVKVKSAAVNPADVKVVTGKKGARFIHSGKSPIRLGYDFSGVIQEIGDNVSGFAQGDEVFGFLPYSAKTTQGSFAEYVVAKSGAIAKKPASISHTEAAAAATTASTALQSLVNIGGIKHGQKILINGASGGVGSYAVQIAKNYEAEVWGTSSAGSLDFLKSIGVDRGLDYRNIALKNLGAEFSIILDAVSNSSFGECAAILAPHGVYVTLLPSLKFISGKMRSFFSNRKCAACIVQSRTEDLARIARMIDEKVISTQLAAAFPFDELQKALATFAAGGVKGKIGIVIEA